MKQRRLKHHADTLAHMACGWQVAGDLHALVRLGSAQLEIDALTGQCQANGKPLRLHLAEALAAWLRRDAEEQGVPFEAFRRAHVTLALKAKVAPSGASVSFDRIADSLVEAAERTYSAHCEKLDEPPYAL